MDRKAIEAELKQKKKELEKLQKLFLKAESGHRSQKIEITLQTSSLTDTAELAASVAGHSLPLTVSINSISQDIKTTSQDTNASQVMTSEQMITDMHPHPDGCDHDMDYQQYGGGLGHEGMLVFPPLDAMVTTQLDFFLPDKEYQSMKLRKLTSVMSSPTSKPEPTRVPTSMLPGMGTQTGANELAVPLSGEHVNTSTEPPLSHPTQLDCCDNQNHCTLRPNSFADSGVSCVWKHIDGTIKDAYSLDSSFGFKTKVPQVQRRHFLQDVAVANRVISMVHVDEEEERESVCVHMLPSGVSAMPATNWLYASWIMDQGELVDRCFLLIQENTTFCFVIAFSFKLYVIDLNHIYVLNLGALDQSCSSSPVVRSWSAEGEVLVAVATTGKELCHSTVCVWTLHKADGNRWQARGSGLGTRLPLPRSVGNLVSLCEVLSTPQLLGITHTSAVLWDVHSHGLLMVMTLCCCSSGCGLFPVVVGATAEKGSLFLLLGCKQGGVSPEQLRNDADRWHQPSSVAWLVVCNNDTVVSSDTAGADTVMLSDTTAGADTVVLSDTTGADKVVSSDTTAGAISNECIQTCDLVQSYVWVTRPWGYQWCGGGDFATQVSQDTVLLWNIMSGSPYGTLSFDTNCDIYPDTKVYWSNDRKLLVVTSGDNLHVLSQCSNIT